MKFNLWTLLLRLASSQRFTMADQRRRWIPEANGTGAAWLDYDNDGRLDLLIVNGSTMDALPSIASGSAPPPRKDGVFLYRNLGNGRFRDVTAEARLTNSYWGTGANAADYDNDGYHRHPDHKHRRRPSLSK